MNRTTNFKTILLDADGTLFDFNACEKNALTKVFVMSNEILKALTAGPILLKNNQKYS